MLRHVGFLWDAANEQAADVAGLLSQRLRSLSTEWTVGLDLEHAGARIFYVPDQMRVYQRHRLGGDGVVLGAVFNNEGALLEEDKASFSRSECASITSSSGQALTRGWWGNYVAFISNGGSTRILRSPMGSLPAFLTCYEGVTVCFSDFEDCTALGLINCEINWRYIDAHILQFGPETHETGIAGVEEVRVGECVEVRDNARARSFHWNPLDIASHNLIEDAAAAAEALRNTTRRCVHSWAAKYEHILHSLSGGLDSSIVLSCLTDAPNRPHITCVNHYSAGCNSDERSYARLAAKHAGCRLIEHLRDADVPLDELKALRLRSPKPAFYIGYLEGGRVQTSYASQLQATALCSGTGGDQLFYLVRAVHAVGDYIFHHGIGSQVIPIAYNAARLERKSLWNVLRLGLVAGLSGQRWHPSEEADAQRILLRSDKRQLSAADTNYGVHPWFTEPSNASNGKRYHAFSLMSIPFFYNPVDGDCGAPSIFPLLSQPLVELMLRVPTYVLTVGGWDRAIARRAFANDIPKEIVARRTKGGLEEHARALFVRNWRLIREMLLDGLLVQHGYVDIRQLESTLSLDPNSNTAANVEIFEVLSLEAWLRSASASSVRAAVAA